MNKREIRQLELGNTVKIQQIDTEGSRNTSTVVIHNLVGKVVNVDSFKEVISIIGYRLGENKVRGFDINYTEGVTINRSRLTKHKEEVNAIFKEYADKLGNKEKLDKPLGHYIYNILEKKCSEGKYGSDEKTVRIKRVASSIGKFQILVYSKPTHVDNLEEVDVYTNSLGEVGVDTSFEDEVLHEIENLWYTPNEIKYGDLTNSNKGYSTNFYDIANNGNNAVLVVKHEIYLPVNIRSKSEIVNAVKVIEQQAQLV